MIAARQTLHGGGRKPYDAEVEYLEGDGSAFIVIPYQATMKDKISVTHQRTTLQSAIIFGARLDGDTGDDIYLYHERNNDTLSRQKVGVFSGSFTWYSEWLRGAELQLTQITSSVDFSKGEFVTWDGSVVALNATKINYTHGNFGLFAKVKKDGTAYQTTAVRIFGFSVLRDGELIFDLVPVRKGSVGYLYDRVSGELFGNQGEGAFILGPDKVQSTVSAKSYIQDGLIAMWDGIENAGYGKHDATATTWIDVVGGVKASTISGATFPKVEDDKVVFDGSSKLQLPQSFGEDLCEDLTIEAVYYTTNTTDRMAILQTYQQDQTTVSEVCIEQNSGKVKTGVARAYFGLVAGNQYSFYHSPIASPIVRTCTFTRAINGDNTYTIGGFENAINKTVSTDAQSMPSSWGFTKNKTPICIGGRLTTRNYMLKGWLHNIRLYNRALTDAEIAHNYAVDKERFGL